MKFQTFLVLMLIAMFGISFAHPLAWVICGFMQIFVVFAEKPIFFREKHGKIESMEIMTVEFDDDFERPLLGYSQDSDMIHWFIFFLHFSKPVK